MRAGFNLLVGLALWCAASAAALAEKRVALVIGNSGYQHSVALANPANDASAIAKMFKDIGFDVVEVRRDVPALELRRATAIALLIKSIGFDVVELRRDHRHEV
jgi:uncharacterized caspase-like protein